MLQNRPVFLMALSLALMWLFAAAAQSDDQSTFEYWPNFRGPGGLGRSTSAKPSLKIDADQGGKVVWRVALPKRGMSSPIVWKDQIFLTGADQESRQIYSLAADTGQFVWTHDVSGLEDEPANGTLPRVLEETGLAAPTPTTNGQHIAAVFATGELVCVNLKGERIWARHLGVPVNHYGHSSSLINDGKRLFVQFDHSKAAKLFAFDLATGALEWSIDRDVIGWSSPILIDNSGRRELVLANSKSVAGYDPATGKQLWHVECLRGEVAPSPAFDDGIVVVANEGAVATAIDIRDHEAGARVLWEWDESLPDTSSPVAGEGLIILPTAFGVVTCLDARNGNRVWEHEFDTGFSSSPIVSGNHVFLVDLRGRMQIFKLSKVFEADGQVDLGEAVYATPAIMNDRIFIRGLDQGICIQFASN